jgi:hypothetical protein
VSTRIHSFVPVNVRHVPLPFTVTLALDWLRQTIDAREISACTPGHIIFFDCGEGLDLVGCPHCRKDIGGPLWKDWMDESCTLETGFTLTGRVLPCCGKSARLDQLVFDGLCVFGSFAIEITDTMTNLSDDEFAMLGAELQARLQCRLVGVDAHY